MKTLHLGIIVGIIVFVGGIESTEHHIAHSQPIILTPMDISNATMLTNETNSTQLVISQMNQHYPKIVDSYNVAFYYYPHQIYTVTGEKNILAFTFVKTNTLNLQPKNVEFSILVGSNSHPTLFSAYEKSTSSGSFYFPAVFPTNESYYIHVYVNTMDGNPMNYQIIPFEISMMSHSRCQHDIDCINQESNMPQISSQKNKKMPIFEESSSPLKQLKSGTAPKDVTCRQGLWLIFKTSDGSPACVWPN